MKKSKFSEDQIVGILGEAARGDKTHQQLCKDHGISLHTFYLWNRKYAGLQREDLHQLRKVERANAQLKRLLAERDLEIPFGDRFIAFARRKGFEIVFDQYHDVPRVELTWKSNKRINSLEAYLRSSDGRFDIVLRQRRSNWLSRILYLYYQRDLGGEGMYRIGAGNWNALEDLLNKLIDRLNTVALGKGGMGSKQPVADEIIVASLIGAIEGAFEDLKEPYANTFVERMEAADHRLSDAGAIANDDLRGLYNFASEFFFQMSHGDPDVSGMPPDEASAVLNGAVEKLRNGDTRMSDVIRRFIYADS